MSDLLTFKTGAELAISAVILGGFNTYLPDIFNFVCIIVVLSWVRYIFIDREKPKSPVLNPKEWQKFVLGEKIKISHNVALYRFALPKPDDVLGLPVGQHISVQAEIDGQVVQRSYTPTSSDDDRGYFDLLIKSYPTGRVSKYIGEMEVGKELTVKGPKGQFKYTPGMVRAFGMIAGGTGITPMLQIIKAILKNRDDETKISLIFANVNHDDILLKSDLDDLVRQNENFNIYYVLNNPPEGWTGGVGFVTEEMIKEHCPPPASNIKILLCGPNPMMSAMSNYCENLGYDKSRSFSKLEDQVFKF